MIEKSALMTVEAITVSSSRMLWHVHATYKVVIIVLLRRQRCEVHRAAELTLVVCTNIAEVVRRD